MKWTENGITFEATAKEFLEIWTTIHPAPAPELAREIKPRKRPELVVIGHVGDEHKFTTIKGAASYLSIVTQREISPNLISHRKSNTLFVKDYMPCNKAWNPEQTTTTDKELANA